MRAPLTQEERNRRTRAVFEASEEASRKASQVEKTKAHKRARNCQKGPPVLAARTLEGRMSKELLSDRTWNQAGTFKAPQIGNRF